MYFKIRVYFTFYVVTFIFSWVFRLFISTNNVKILMAEENLLTYLLTYHVIFRASIGV